MQYKLTKTLELGTYEIKYAEVEYASAGEIKLKQYYKTETPKQFVVSTFIENPIIESLPIQNTISNMIKSLKLKYEDILLILPDHSALLNLIITTPHYSKKEIEQAIKDDFATIMPIPLENWHIDYTIVGPWEDQEIIMAVAAIKNNIVEIGGLVQKAGLNPKIIDVNFFNVANLIEHYLISEDNKGKNIVLVHLGHETTSIGIFRDGQIRTFLNRPIGGYDFTKQLSKHFQVEEKDAEQFKRNEIFFLPEPSPEQESLYNYTVIKNVFTALVREIFSAIEGYLTRFREFTIHEVIISGGGANFQNIDVMLANNFNTSVKYVGNLYQLYINDKPQDLQEKNLLAPVCGSFLRD